MGSSIKGTEMRHLLVTGLVAALLLVPMGSLVAEEALPAATFGPDEAETLQAMHDRAVTLREEGDYAAAHVVAVDPPAGRALEQVAGVLEPRADLDLGPVG